MELPRDGLMNEHKAKSRCAIPFKFISYNVNQAGEWHYSGSHAKKRELKISGRHGARAER